MRLRFPALAVLTMIAAGCLSHREHWHVYALEGPLDAPTQATVVAARPVLQLQRVLVPDYLDTTEIVLRVGQHEIHESATGRFAERLSLGVTQALRADLASRLPQYTVALAQSIDESAREILVNVDAFDVWPTGRCALVADWSILDADHRTLLSADHGSFTTSTTGANSDDGAIVTAMADAVRQLADQIAASAQALPPRVAGR